MAIKTEITELPAALLTVDPRVQRSLDMKRVKKIADRWDDLMVGVITVSARRSGRTVLDPVAGDYSDTSYVVLDGQTRLAAFREVCGQNTQAKITCQVHHGLTEAEEARVFLDHNDRKSVYSADRFRIAVVAGETWATEITEVLAANGWAGRGVDVGKPMRQFGPVVAVERIYDLGGRDAVVKTFQTITNAWGSKDRDAVCAQTLYGLGMLHARHPDLTSKQLHGFVTKLSKIAPGKMIGEITADKRRYSQSVQVASYAWVIELYNRSRAAANKIA